MKLSHEWALAREWPKHKTGDIDWETRRGVSMWVTGGQAATWAPIKRARANINITVQASTCLNILSTTFIGFMKQVKITLLCVQWKSINHNSRCSHYFMGCVVSMRSNGQSMRPVVMVLDSDIRVSLSRRCNALVTRWWQESGTLCIRKGSQ